MILKLHKIGISAVNDATYPRNLLINKKLFIFISEQKFLNGTCADSSGLQISRNSSFIELSLYFHFISWDSLFLSVCLPVTVPVYLPVTVPVFPPMTVPVFPPMTVLFDCLYLFPCTLCIAIIKKFCTPAGSLHAIFKDFRLL